MKRRKTRTTQNIKFIDTASVWREHLIDKLDVLSIISFSKTCFAANDACRDFLELLRPYVSKGHPWIFVLTNCRERAVITGHSPSARNVLILHVKMNPEDFYRIVMKAVYIMVDSSLRDIDMRNFFYGICRFGHFGAGEYFFRRKWLTKSRLLEGMVLAAVHQRVFFLEYLRHEGEKQNLI